MGLGIRRKRDSALRMMASIERNVESGVALTFNDGPMPGTTDLVLDCLADLEATATFFCVGRNVERNPALLSRILARGTRSAATASPTPHRGVSHRELIDDYRAGHRAVEDVAGRPVNLFRPPYGRVGLPTIGFIRSLQSWTWTVDPGDWQEGADISSLDAELSGRRRRGRRLTA